MQATIEIVLPIFALVFCGYAAARFGLLKDTAVQGLSGFVFYLAIPALLFRTLARGFDLSNINLEIVLAYFGGSVSMFFLALLIGRRVLSISPQQVGLMAMGTCFSNTVLLGIPLILTAFGEAAMLDMMMIITFHSLLLLPLVALLVELGRSEGQGLSVLVKTLVKSVLQNPVILAILAGLAYVATGWPIPGTLDTFIGLLGDAAPACALVAMGASLTAFRLAGDLRETMIVVLLKLVAHPALVALLAFWVFDLSPLAAAVAVVTAALPAGANVFIFAQHYRVYRQRAASIVLISTALSIASVALLIAHFRAAG